MPAVTVRTSFTILVTTLGLALLLVNREHGSGRNLKLISLGGKECVILVAAGLLGGIVSALIGTGENSVTFMVMDLLFRINEKIATPTTVILMTMTTIPGFLIHLFWLKDFSPAVMGYWLAAIPVVAVFGPLGALICVHMSRRSRFGLSARDRQRPAICGLPLGPSGDRKAFDQNPRAHYQFDGVLFPKSKYKLPQPCSIPGGCAPGRFS